MLFVQIRLVYLLRQGKWLFITEQRKNRHFQKGLNVSCLRHSPTEFILHFVGVTCALKPGL